MLETMYILTVWLVAVAWEYNDLLSEGEKLWPTLFEKAIAFGCIALGPWIASYRFIKNAKEPSS